MGSSPDAYLPHWTGIGPVYAWVRGSGNSTVEVEDLELDNEDDPLEDPEAVHELHDRLIKIRVAGVSGFESIRGLFPRLRTTPY
jgi:hypothetical protein